MSTLSALAFVFLSPLSTAPNDVPKMPSPALVLLFQSQRDPHAALHFCAARPALHARQGELAASDVDRVCDSIIRMNFHDALHEPTLQELGPSMIRALEKSPTIWYQAEAYSNRYRNVINGVTLRGGPCPDRQPDPANPGRSVARCHR